MGQKENIIYPPNPVDWLRQEYGARRNRNPRYSLRAFARQLQMGSGPLIEILLNRRALTLKQGIRLAERLGYSTTERKQFLEAIERLGLKRKLDDGELFQELKADAFQIVSDWYHYAIRELIGTKGFKESPGWIAKRLGISRTEVVGALERLERVGIIQRVNGRWCVQGGVTTTHDLPSRALRQYHTQALEKSMWALHEIAVELRDITSITMGVNPANLAKAKQEIRTFRRRVSRLLQTGERSEVYQLNIQLVPVTK